MVAAKALFQEGKPGEAIGVLTAHLREHPEDGTARTFLFELLCFEGEFDRAEKHLALLAGASGEAMTGAVLYQAALHAERTRIQELERRGSASAQPAAAVQGSFNGRRFQSISDADPRIGNRLEVYAAGDYLWIPFAHLRSVRMDAPKRLRDMLWIPAHVQAGPDLKDRDLGEVLLPVMCAQSYLHPDPAVRLGRQTEWCEDEQGREAPYGLKQLLVDGEEVPLLELRELWIDEHPALVQ